MKPAGTAADPGKALHRLFLTLFLRGRGARGLSGGRADAPTSIRRKLGLTLLLYAAFGCVSLALLDQSAFGLSAYLHAMTFVFVGMFVASSSGEVLFNREEADILLHRPVPPRTLLWAKVRVIVEVSLWLAGAFSLAGTLGVLFAMPQGWRFALAHVVSTILLTLFTVGGIVLVYQLCLKHFGRERLESLMTTAQVLVAIGAVLSGQLPRLLLDGDHRLPAALSAGTGWMAILPPAWFAGLDDVLHGNARLASWILALMAIGITALVLRMAFGRLAGVYELGLQNLNETAGRVQPPKTGRPWFHRLADLPLLRRWLRDPVTRASFLLTAAYLFRDRDVKLRLYPGLAPFLVMPVIILVQEQGKHGGGKGFGIAFLVAFLGVVPLMAQSLLQHSQQWQAADLFRTAPLHGPARLCDGARRAVAVLLVLPMVFLAILALAVFPGAPDRWLLLLPGLIALPVCARIPANRGWVPPLSQPVEESRSASRGLWAMLAMFASMGLAGMALLAKHFGALGWFLTLEAIFAAGLYALLRHRMERAPWPEAD
jgi:hypothetical protein